MAFAEARYGRDGKKNSYPSVLVSRLSFDAAGTRWGEPSVLQASVNVNIGNALPIADLVTGDLFLFFCWNNKDIFLSSTKDNGVTWSSKSNMSTWSVACARVHYAGVYPGIYILSI